MLHSVGEVSGAWCTSQNFCIGPPTSPESQACHSSQPCSATSNSMASEALTRNFSSSRPAALPSPLSKVTNRGSGKMTVVSLREISYEHLSYQLGKGAVQLQRKALRKCMHYISFLAVLYCTIDYSVNSNSCSLH